MVSFASKAGVSSYYARKVVNELTVTGCLLCNPCSTKLHKNITCCVSLDFTLEEEVFLLALRIECPYHPNTDYVIKLKDFYNWDILASTILVWFRNSFEYAGTYKVPNVVPIDKWMMWNATRTMTYHAIIDMFPDHSKWNFLDKKHIVNGDILPKKVRVDPLTGYIDIIPA
jgi:hypothetical protein